MLKGFLYVMANAGMPDLYKVGYTTRSLKERERELSSHEGVPYPFFTRFSIRLREPAKAEKAAHMMYDLKRVYTDKEFFRFTDDEEFGYFLEHLVSICFTIHNGFDFDDAIATAALHGIETLYYDIDLFKRQYPDAIELNVYENYEVPIINGKYPNEWNFAKTYADHLASNS